ncbi:hypothetical protein AG0111_0g3527 [Alternaria gaisen]|uniref:Uncharacterized protein n=1 Tax=Alternaria gaisen TaxID=167740 RepID=A0ACB6FXU1_9PLEO|nr:hypothetical protein AG0111_0g3527 [Alternaria gaisen]
MAASLRAAHKASAVKLHGCNCDELPKSGVWEIDVSRRYNSIDGG